MNLKPLGALFAVVLFFAVPSFASAHTPDAIQLSGPTGLTSSSTATFTFEAVGDGHSPSSVKFQCRLDSTGAWEECSSPTAYSGLADGPHRFEVRAAYRGPHWWWDCFYTVPAIAEFTVDTTPPETTIDASPVGTITTAEATVEFSADGPATFECRLDSDAPGDWSPCSSPANFTDLTDGAHRIEVRAVDAAGNPDPSPAVAEFTVDTTAPETTIDAAPVGTIGTAETAVEFSADGPATFECRLDSEVPTAWKTCSSPTTLVGLADGAHRFEARAVDAAGNIGKSAAAVTFAVDTSTPETIVDTAPSARLEVNEASFTFSSSAGEAFECRLDPQPDSPWEPCDSSVSFKGLPQGEHVFEVRAGDRFGRFDPTPARVVFFVDIPVNGALLKATPLAGTVLIKVPGATGFRPLTEGETIAFGSVVDTTEGKVSLTSIDPVGEEQRASFFKGTFRVNQQAGARLVTLELRGGNLNQCAAEAAGAARASAKGSGAALWGSGHGSFRTEGNNGSATVRGTIWLTEDTCEGTFFKVNRGLVAVRDFRRHKTVMVPSGRSYLARNPAP
jgi:hypothetical protein